MKKFTVKDFLLYACPCFGCDKPNSVHIAVAYHDKNMTEEVLLDKIFNDKGSISPTVTQNNMRIFLKITYDNALSIVIDHKTNKFATNDIKLLKKYLEEHSIAIRTSCGCNTIFETQSLRFNLEKGFVYPFEMYMEFLAIKTDKNIFYCSTWYDDKKSSVDVMKIDNQSIFSSIRFELPLLPKYKLKNKEHFINKMQTYLTFM